MTDSKKIGIVIIGRNEGERLVRCLNSVNANNYKVVYVDSHSTDQSVQNAKNAGAEIVNLDMSKPFSAAKARNAGWTLLIERFPDLEFIQFIDGDCELHPNWLASGLANLSDNKNVAVCFGRLKEKHPNKSFYNRLCQDEWDSQAGEVKNCGGIALIRTQALKAANGYNEKFIAGEEPEMCYRMRLQGWKILKIVELMATHDADMHAFSQFWKRSKRCGFAYALTAYTHGRDSERLNVKEVVRAMFWAGLLPLILVLSMAIHIAALWGLLIYPIQILRLYLKAPDKSLYRFKVCSILVISKFSECFGILSFIKKRIFRKEPEIMEYK